MNDLARLLLIPLLVVAGWLLSAYNAEVTRKSVRVLSLITAVVFVIIVLSGLLQNQQGAFDVHKWSGHAIVIGLWLFWPYTVGIALQSNLRTRPRLAIAQVVIVLLLLGLAVPGSSTGYLAPSAVEDIAEESKNRYIVLHVFATPSLIALLIVCWYVSFRVGNLGNKSG